MLNTIKNIFSGQIVGMSKMNILKLRRPVFIP